MKLFASFTLSNSGQGQQDCVCWTLRHTWGCPYPSAVCFLEGLRQGRGGGGRFLPRVTEVTRQSPGWALSIHGLIGSPAAFSSVPTPCRALTESDVGAVLPPPLPESPPPLFCWQHSCLSGPPASRPCRLSTPLCLVLILSPAHRVHFIPKIQRGISETSSFLSIHTKCPAPHGSTVPSLRSDCQPLWSSLCEGRVLKRTLCTGAPLPVLVW